ncbi:MAG TPA: DUF2332 domain-containing protein, partial [Sporichthya sp.]|nr:DUF2332 domain-containing protein [Sporichthya sp.]
MSTAAVFDLEAHLRRQSAACADLGSPMYEALLAFAADDYAAGGPVAEVLAGWTSDPGPAALALRLLGTVHRFALTGQAPELGRLYPSVAGADVEPFDPGAAWVAFRDLLVSRFDQVRAGLASPPQTNEIGRSALLIGGLLVLRSQFDLPVRLVEIGASAGLNLRPDQVRIELPDGEGVGPPGSPVTLSDVWHGMLPPLDRPIEIVDRYGADLDPVDVTAAAGRLRLLSYVWPDQPARINRLRGAFDLAAALPVPVIREGAVQTVSALKPVPGTVTVIWHSVMTQYLPEAERDELRAAFQTLGALATAEAPVARLAFEASRVPSASGVQFGLRLSTWPGA